MKRLFRDQEKEFADQVRLLRAWKHWHQEQLDDALAGAHGATIAELITLLDRLELNSAAALLGFMQRTDWNSVDYDTRLTVLHQINQAIMRMRDCHGLTPIDDPLPQQADNVFRRIKQLLFPPLPASDRPAPPTKDASAAASLRLKQAMIGDS